METKEYRTVDKSEWGGGPWDDEPDKVQYQDEVTGMPCLIVRGPLDVLCGYVGVDENHPWHGKEYSDDDVCVDVHGGLTFSESCQEIPEGVSIAEEMKGNPPEAVGICHIPGPGEPDNVWWFGFDTGHHTDLTPTMNKSMREWREQYNIEYKSGLGQTYKTIDYVKEQIQMLAIQLLAVQKHGAAA
jgi:hypothetical protein